MHSGYGVTQTCLPAAHRLAPLTAWYNTNNSRPLRGAKPREADDAKTPEGIGLLWLAPEGRRVLCRVHLTRLS